jgi:hypothetical protein
VCRLPLPLCLLSALLASALSCSFALDHSPDQCNSDADCVRFRATCNLKTKLCAARGPTVDVSVRPRDASFDADDGGPGDVAAMTAPAADWPCGRPGKPTVRLQGDIGVSDRLICENDYLLVGPVFVRPGAILTIDAGTTVLGDVTSKGMLVVQPGARLLADGVRGAPIVFTSAAPPPARRPGDWGGVVLLGRAWTNSQHPLFPGVSQGGEYGGTDDDDTSGVLRFVRIEYAGNAGLPGPGGTVAGLGLRAVGRATAINHVMVREVAGDCFEFAGGTVGAKHLVCQHSRDDGFQWREGYRGKLQFLAHQAMPAAPADSHGFEGESDGANAGTPPVSEPIIYNATLCGPRVDPAGEQFGISLRAGSRAHVHDTIVTAFQVALDVRDDRTVLDMRSSQVWPVAGAAGVTQLYMEPGRRNVIAAPNIGDCADALRPGFAPSPAIKENASVPPADGFFEPAAYLGAFRDLEDNWARGPWVAFSER